MEEELAYDNDLFNEYDDSELVQDKKSNYLSFKIFEKEHKQKFTIVLNSLETVSDDNSVKNQWYMSRCFIEDVKTIEEAVSFNHKNGEMGYISLPKKAFKKALNKKGVLKKEAIEASYLELEVRKLNSRTLIIDNYRYYTNSEMAKKEGEKYLESVKK